MMPPAESKDAVRNNKESTKEMERKTLGTSRVCRVRRNQDEEHREWQKKNGDGESSRKQTKKCCGAADDGGERKSDDDAATPKKRNRKELRAPLATVTAAIGGANKLRSHTHRKGRKNERDSTGIRVEGGWALQD